MRILLSFLLLFHAALAAAQAGHIEATEGDVQIYDVARQLRSSISGAAVFEGDTIVTGPNSEVHLAMADEGQIAVRPESRLVITRYKAEGGADDGSVITLLQGALRSVTGWIGKYAPKNYAIKTTTATIGVRGTDHETRVVGQGGDGEAGTYDKVNHGATILMTPHGQTEVRPNQAGFAALSGRSRPRVLERVPQFFRPAQFDRKFGDLHKQVAERIAAKRSERIEKLKTLRGKGDSVKKSREQHHGEQDRLRRSSARGDEREAQRVEQRRQRWEDRQEREDRGSGRQERPRDARSHEHPRVGGHPEREGVQRGGRGRD